MIKKEKKKKRDALGNPDVGAIITANIWLTSG